LKVREFQQRVIFNPGDSYCWRRRIDRILLHARNEGATVTLDALCIDLQ